MEVRHVKLDYETALNSTKQILMSEANLLRILEKVSSYKKLRKSELELKNKLRIALINLIAKIDLINEHLPSETIKIKKKAKKQKESKESRNIQEELVEIKRKLERLG